MNEVRMLQRSPWWERISANYRRDSSLLRCLRMTDLGLFTKLSTINLVILNNSDLSGCYRIMFRGPFPALLSGRDKLRVTSN
jgi:hypothetical protein